MCIITKWSFEMFVPCSQGYPMDLPVEHCFLFTLTPQHRKSKTVSVHHLPDSHKHTHKNTQVDLYVQKISQSTKTCLNGQHNDDNGRNVKGRTLNHGCFFHSPLKIIKSRIQVFKKLLIRLIYLYIL